MWVVVNLKEERKPRFYVTDKKLEKELVPLPEKPNAAIEHLLYEIIEKIPTFKDGLMINIETRLCCRF